MKVLLVRTSSMGDLVHTLPAIEDLAKNRPDVELHWLCEEAFADIARLHPFVKKVHVMAWRRWRKNLVSRETWAEFFAFKKKMREGNYDKVLDAQGLIKSAIFSRMAKTAVTGLDKTSARESMAAFFYQEKFQVVRGENAVWRNRQLFAQVFAYTFTDEVDFGVRLPESVQWSGYPEQYHVCLTAASRDHKLWPEEHWRQLFTVMHQHDGLPIYLPFGNNEEKMRAERLAQDFAFVSVCPKMTLHEASILLGKATSVIGVDTGLLHLANAFNRPLIGIYTATDPNKTGVQSSPRAVNIGGIGIIPTVQQIDEVWQRIQMQ
ncbi:MAG: lipopolysaccharide heptosyltransferase I [Neisseria sp.]|nr:lipopolysaccharide heptosyltransferase I [Neisseria sp.]